MSLGKWNAGGITPMIWRISPETKYDRPITDESPPNQLCQSWWLITTTSSPSSGTGTRPSIGRTPRVGYMSGVGQAIGMRSTRSGVRSVEVPPPNTKTPSSSFEFSL